MRLLMLLFLILTAPLAAYANTVETAIGAIGKTTYAGRQVVVPIYFHNTGHTPVTIELAPVLLMQLSVENETVQVQAKKVGDQDPSHQTINAQGFIKAQYVLTLPKDLRGMVYLSVPDIKNAGLYLSVTEAPSDPKHRFAWLPKTSDQSMDTLIQLYQPYIKNISYYEPIYFLVGTAPEDSKFQFSFKYRFFSKDKSFVKKYPWLQGFHFGYTQTSYWDLDSDSAPFEDTSYKPELFFNSQRLKTEWPALDALFLKTGIRHESNGRGGELSRSTNTIYIEPDLIFYSEKRRTGLKITPRVWTYIGNEDETNPDLHRYRGYFDLSVSFGKADNLVVDTHFQWAAEGTSVQVDFTYPLHSIFILSHLDTYLQVQYASALGESLINYTNRTEAVRLGFAIVR
jgi:phospholipase A1/A2